MTAPAGGDPMPVNGLVGRTGLGLGLGVGLGAGAALEDGVGVGVGEAEAATGRGDVSRVDAIPIPTPAATTTAAVTPAMTFCLVLRARTRSSTITMLPPHGAQQIAAMALDPERPAFRRCRSSAASHDALRGEESVAFGGFGGVACRERRRCRSGGRCSPAHTPRAARRPPGLGCPDAARPSPRWHAR